MNRLPRIDSVPVVDYRAHPAYRDLDSADRRDDSAVEALIGEIDRHVDAIRGLADSTAQQRGQEFSARVSPLMDQLQRQVTGGPAMRPLLVEYASSAIGLAHGFLRESMDGRSYSRDRAGIVGGLTAEREARLGALHQQGFCRFDAANDLARRIWSATRWERGLLEHRRRTFPTRHAVIPLQFQSPGARLVRQALEDAGVLQIASAYIGRPMDFLYAALDLAHNGQTWYRDCYADVGIATARTVYMHFDADSDVMKAMLYLRDVDAESGPFKFLRGSHLWKRSAVVGAVQRGFDQAQGKYFEVEADGLDFKFGYYRPRFRVAEHRKDTLALPRALRGSTHFGDDILDDSALSEGLLQEEETFIGPAGSLVLFDGSQGLHRGSLVRGDSRWAIQIGLRVQRAQPSPARRFLRAAKGRVAYQVTRARGWMSRPAGE